MRILVIRNDRLGDFMLAWPALSLLKHYLPHSQVDVLVPDYTAPMAKICPWIDHVVTMPNNKPSLTSAMQLGKQLAEQRYDAMISLYASGTTAIAGVWAQIPYRLAPATKWMQLLATRRLTQRRSHSIKPEFAYNCDLIYCFLQDYGIATRPLGEVPSAGEFLPTELHRPLLHFSGSDISRVRDRFCQQHQIPTQHRLIFIHPGSGGSATTLQLIQYATLVSQLDVGKGYHFVITAGPGEAEQATALKALLCQHQVTILQPEGGLVELAHHLAFADLLISGSTGPLHIAGALDRPTATFYPGHRSATPLRWQPLNSADRRVAFTPPTGGDPKDVSRSEIEPAATAINQLLQRLAIR